MSLRNRISQFLWTLVAQIRCSKGNIILGRVSGPGAAQEITIGTGLELSGMTLNVTGVGSGGNAQTVTSIGNLTGVITSVNRATSIADGALSIAKTSGLRGELDDRVLSSTFNYHINGLAGDIALKANTNSPIFTGILTAQSFLSSHNDATASYEADRIRNQGAELDFVFPSQGGYFAMTSNPDGSIDSAVAIGTTAPTNGVTIPETLIITGITTPAASNPVELARVADIGGFPAWELGGGSGWICAKPGTHWIVGKNTEIDYFARVESDAPTPVGLTGWEILEGAGQPVIAGTGLTGGTLAPPFLRVAGGVLYVQDAGVWKQANLSALT